jgi:lipopolysaccharide transport system ATP-binding protein
MEPIIEIRNISKQYQLGERSRFHESFRETLIDTFRKPWQRLRGSPRNVNETPRATSFWALRNVSLDIERGDTVGIIGSNGAGKSTLLKILSQITEPTEGYIKIRGRMASLLEVGTGFHPELTGRENIYLNGSILGMHKVEIDAKFDEIVEFSGIGKFLDTPVKRYSSGMYVRLAFSIAAHLDPEIMIVDEVLAVGDVGFQRKCLGKMAEASANNRTIFFVSHNLAAVETLCNRAIVLRDGMVVFTGDAKDAIDYYLHNAAVEDFSSASHIVDLSCAPGRSPKYDPHLTSVELYTSNDMPVCGELPLGAPLKAVIHFTLKRPCASFDASIAFDTLSGQRICTAHSAYEPERIHEVRSGEQVLVCDIPSVPLIPGEYKLSVGLDIPTNIEVDWVEDVKRVTVTRTDYYGTGIVPTKGAFLLQNRWTLDHTEEMVGR